MLIWLIMSIMCSLFPLQVFDILDLEVLEFWLFIELAIFECFLTWRFKHVRIPVRIYYERSP